ncbi:glycosyltransferase [Chlorogloeopsis sp. ULAP01]|uniref:glycosyltransferase n=1 Tax=Chlorogloeopsis sp. ULAP01 TaxID=3056483 RepID=UPI0025AAEF99|nr:glycosyltransferase [Chlorogloeopsis sp. ULAP01]MDM9381275.1 glycosyltransferase [Chlorogloeopsis sp. ULAP01]
MTKKIVFLIRDLNYGGAQRQLVTLAKSLNQQNFDVTILCFYPHCPLEKDLINSNVKLISLQKQGRWDLIRFFWRLVQYLKHIQPDVLHGYLTEPNLFTICLKPLFPSTRMIWGIRGSNYECDRHDWRVQLYQQLENLLSHFADLIIVNSHAGRDDYLTRGFPASKMIVIPNGIDTERFQPNPEAGAKVRQEWGISEDTILIGLVGRLDPMKDHPTFLKSAALLCAERKDVHFVCVGTGSENYARELHQLTADLGISEKVIWAGARSDMPAVHNALDVAISASAYGEGFSNTLGEAMACGVKCIATDVADSAWIIGDAGLVIPPKSPEALTAAIKQFIDNAQFNGKSREDIRQQVVTRFSVRQLLLKTEAAFLQ